jgi:hypothetical protein
VFYFAINLFIFSAIYQLYKNRKTIYTALLLWVSISVLVLETYSFHSRKLYHNNTISAWENINESIGLAPYAAIDVNKFQAILPLPYFHTGSENVWMGGAENSYILKDVLTASYILGLPTMGVQMSRTSLFQTLQNISLIKDRINYPSLLKILPNKKPLLLWVEKNSNLSASEKTLIRFSALLYEDNLRSLYALETTAFLKILDLNYEQISNEIEYKNLHDFGLFYYTDSIRNFYVNFYDNVKSNKNYKGNGAFEYEINNYNRLFDGALPYQDTIPYTLSFWAYVNRDMLPTQHIIIEQLSSNGTIMDYKGYPIFSYIKAIDNDWALIEISFIPKSADVHLLISIQKNSFRKRIAWIDELYIYPEGQHIYARDEDALMKNNRWIEVGK